MAERPLGHTIKTEGFVGKISVWYLFFQSKHISKVQSMTREMFGTFRFPFIPAELILYMTVSVPELREDILHTQQNVYLH